MKTSRHKKILGIAIGEKSLLIAELVSSDAALERPEVRQVGELTFPDGVSIESPTVLGTELANLLQEKKINTNVAVIGLPAKWIVAATKELPESAMDAATRADILRLSAESEFSTELKDLVFDFVDDAHIASGSLPQKVLLMATPRSYLDAAVATARAAKIKVLAVLPSAVALSEATSTNAANALVLAIGTSGAELTSQHGGILHAMRHLRGANAAQPVSVSDLRRAVSTMPSMRSSALNGNGSAASAKPRELVLWNGESLDRDALSAQTGFVVRAGDLATLGVRPAGNLNGSTDAASYASAISLGLIGLRNGSEKSPSAHPAIDFLHSRLAPVVSHRIPRWTILVGLAAVLLVAIGTKLYFDQVRDQKNVDDKKSLYESRKSQIAIDEAFVANVSFAQAWHGGDPRYLACVRDLTNAIPEDGQTIATSLSVREKPKALVSNSSSASAANRHVADVPMLTGQLYGKTSDQERVQTALARIKLNSAFSSVKLGGTQDAGRGREVTFSITFDYVPPKLPVEMNTRSTEVRR